MEYQDIFIDSKEKKIHSITCKNGKTPFHFLHANGFCAKAYLPFLNLFTEDFNIVATDIPGHGDSSHHNVKLIKHWDIYIDDIKESIIQNMTPPVIGVGHSLGAVITCLVAAKYPELFSKLIMIDPVIFPKRKLIPIGIARKAGLLKNRVPIANGARRRKKEFNSKKEAYERFSSGKGMFKTWQKEFIKSYTEHGLKDNKNGKVSLKCDPETEAQIYESLLLDIWKYPKKLKCPVLLIRGENTDTFDANAAKRLVKEVKDCKLINVPDTSHFVPMENAEHCKKLIIEFTK